MQSSINGAAFVALTDAADADAGTLSGTTVQLLLASLAPSADVRFRFQARVNAATGGLVLNNQATVSADQAGTADTNLVQVPIVGNATVTGRVFRDLEQQRHPGRGRAGASRTWPSWSPTPGRVSIQPRVSPTPLASTRSGVPAGVTAPQRADDDATPDCRSDAALPTEDQSTRSTGEPAVAASTVASATSATDLPPLTVTKTSSAGGTASPGQTMTYAVTVTNNRRVAQPASRLIDVRCPLARATSRAAPPCRRPARTFRVTEYYIRAGPFAGHDLQSSPSPRP